MEIGPLIYHLRCDLPRHPIARRYYLDKLISAYTLKEVKALLRLRYVREVWSSQVNPFCDVAAVIESIQEGDSIRCPGWLLLLRAHLLLRLAIARFRPRRRALAAC